MKTGIRMLLALGLATIVIAAPARAGQPEAPALPPPLPVVTVTASVPASRSSTATQEPLFPSAQAQAMGFLRKLSTEPKPTRDDPMNLRAALDRALRQSALIDGAKAGTEVFEARLDQAKSGQYPMITVESLFTPMPAKTGGRTSGHTDYSRWGVFLYTQLSGSVPLYGFSKIQHLKTAASLGVSVGKAQEDIARAEVRFRVLKGWFALSFARDMQSIVHEGRAYFDRAKRHVAKCKAADDPSFDPIDEMKIRVYEAQMRARELEAARLLTLALGSLRWALGEDPGTGPDIAREPLGLLTPSREVTLGEAIETAVIHRPELVALRRGLAAGGAEAKARYWAMYPDFVLAGKFNYAYSNVADTGSNPFAGNPFNGWNASGGLALRWDLDLGRKLGEWREAQAARHRLEAGLAEAERGVRLEVESLHREMADARTMADSQGQALKAARDWVEDKLDKYEHDQASLRDALDGLLPYLLARLEAQKALYDFDVAAAALERASGMDLVPLAGAQRAP
jgi:outer membrane protein